jgi:hypothetical protein
VQSNIHHNLDVKFLLAALGPGDYSASNKNENEREIIK